MTVKKRLSKIKTVRLLFTFTAVVGLVFAPFTNVIVSATPEINQFQLPTPYSSPFDIIDGSDGALWFTENSADQIGRITTSGAITEYPVPTSNSGPSGITNGPDGAIWFTEENGNKIGRITTSGTITEYPMPFIAGATSITTGSDGALWFAGQNNFIGRMTTSGSFSEYAVPDGVLASGPITSGPDGNLWYTMENGDIASITTAGQTTVYQIPSPNADATFITTGPDGNLWFSDVGDNSIGSITPSGTIVEYPAPAGDYPTNITTGSDGNLWFDGYYGNQIDSITTSGIVTQYNLPSPNSYPYGIAAGSDGNIWFTENNLDEIGQLVLSSVPAAPTNLSIPSPTTEPVLSWDSVMGSTGYNIYRNSVEIGSSTSNSYTDSNAPTGNDSYYVTATNSIGESSPSNTVNVTVDTTPTITSSSYLEINARDPVNFTVTTSGSPAPSITETGSLPTGISFNNNGNGTATLSGQASPVNQGYYFITFTATNVVGYSTQSFILAVNDAQTAPTFLNAASVTENQGTVFSFTIDTTGNPIPTINKVSGSGNLPTGVKLTDNNDGTATLSGDADGRNAAGTYNFTIKAKNKNGSATQNFTLTIE